tara:strand:- start:2061 stop:2489 length:429 start_codon:yes stop_codon:yes gene_type:complete
MNLEKITYKIIKESIKDDFILRMMISYLSDEQKGTVMDEIVNEREHVLFKKEDIVWFDPIDNKYDLKDLCQEDMMKDAKLMDEHGHIKGVIIDDTNYQDGVNPYATEYKVNAYIGIKDNYEGKFKKIRVRRSNIIKLWKPLA